MSEMAALTSLHVPDAVEKCDPGSLPPQVAYSFRQERKPREETMGISREQLDRAVQTAHRMVEAGTDPADLAAVLLHLYQQNRQLEQLFQLTERYLQFGMPPEEHSRLGRLVEQIREQRRSASDELDYGL